MPLNQYETDDTQRLRNLEEQLEAQQKQLAEEQQDLIEKYEQQKRIARRNFFIVAGLIGLAIGAAMFMGILPVPSFLATAMTFASNNVLSLSVLPMGLGFMAFAMKPMQRLNWLRPVMLFNSLALLFTGVIGLQEVPGVGLPSVVYTLKQLPPVISILAFTVASIPLMLLMRWKFGSSESSATSSLGASNESNPANDRDFGDDQSNNARMVRKLGADKSEKLLDSDNSEDERQDQHQTQSQPTEDLSKKQDYPPTYQDTVNPSIIPTKR